MLPPILLPMLPPCFPPAALMLPRCHVQKQRRVMEDMADFLEHLRLSGHVNEQTKQVTAALGHWCRQQ